MEDLTKSHLTFSPRLTPGGDLTYILENLTARSYLQTQLKTPLKISVSERFSELNEKDRAILVIIGEQRDISRVRTSLTTLKMLEFPTKKKTSWSLRTWPV